MPFIGDIIAKLLDIVPSEGNNYRQFSNLSSTLNTTTTSMDSNTLGNNCNI